ncbi:DNA repair protein rad16 [Smittium mucronatum]|uniref:DNA repair protein rad16 n=1 Tax=Smittium mucronatum TaxID=133383 RepID=A0A1R0GPP1_9FUNG|nr:DNA repair protein rad16 [Smittium mucronatum]
MPPILGFQRAIIDKLLEEDALCILGEGLGHQRILLELVRICATENTLVFLLNCDSDEEDRIRQGLLELKSGEESMIPILNIIKNDTLSSQRFKLYFIFYKSLFVFINFNFCLNNYFCIRIRSKMYLKGGIISVTSRILLVDMLNNIVPLQLVTGILVNNAHSVTAEGNDAFILRLYREKNQEGFIKAISDKANIFNKDFSGVESNLKHLQLRKLHLWPRFQMEIKSYLQQHVNVIEYKQSMTERMFEAQQTIVDCMVTTVNEIKRLNRYVEFDDFEYSMNTEFESKIRKSLNPFWHRVSSKTKQLVSDLRILRYLMISLMRYDCVMFNEYLESLLVSSLPGKTSIFKNGQESSWMLTDSGNLLFNIARQRVFKIKPKDIITQNSDSIPGLNIPPEIELVLEPLPKWELVKNIISEIQSENIDVKPDLSESDPKNQEFKNSILIMVESKNTLTQLIEYLEGLDSLNPKGHHIIESGQKQIDSLKSHPKLLIKAIQSYFIFKKNLGGIKKVSNSEAYRKSGEPSSISNGRDNNFNPRQPFNKRRRTRGSSFAASNTPSILLRKNQSSIELEAQTQDITKSFFSSSENPSPQEKTTQDEDLSLLDDFKLDYDLNYGILPRNNLINIRVYDGPNDSQMLIDYNPSNIIMYTPNTEFIRQIEVMVIPLQPVKAVDLENDLRMSLIRSIAPLNYMGSSKKRLESADGILFTKEKYRVIVDVREFRSPLPFSLYKTKPHDFETSVEIIPRTLLIGDYVIHDRCCIERKSVPDLIQSLSSGRLYSQAQSMTAYYEFPVLLIEFDSSLSFSLSNVREYDTELLLSEENHPEPEIERAVKMGLEQNLGERNAQYSNTSFKMLQSLPGVGSTNAYKLASAVANIRDLCNMSLDQLQKIIGISSGKELFSFMNESH